MCDLATGDMYNMFKSAEYFCEIKMTSVGFQELTKDKWPFE